MPTVIRGCRGNGILNGYDPLVPANGPTEPLVPLQPDPSDSSQLNNLLGSVELTVNQPSGWQHRVTAFNYWYRYNELNPNGDAERTDPYGDPIEFARMRLITLIAGDLNIRGIIRRARGRTLRLGIAWKMKMGLWAMFCMGRRRMGSG